jgi:hypothetical protein
MKTDLKGREEEGKDGKDGKSPRDIVVETVVVYSGINVARL